MTKKLYWETPYETKFSAKVKSIEEDGIVLDKTLFYPESGNQLCDRGILKIKEQNFNIEIVTKEGDNIKHHLTGDFKENISIGDEVEGEIDWEYRFGLMRAHSSQHVFSAVLKSKYDIDTIRANLNFEEIFLKWTKKVDSTQLKEIFYEVNTICTTKDLKITSKVISQEETRAIAKKVRSKIPKEPQVRLIEIENMDLVCCGGTHIQTTTEIGNLFIFDFKKGNEIRYYVGNKAVSMDSSMNIKMITLANELNSPIENLRENVVKRVESLKNIQSQQKELSIKLLEMISKLPSKIINNISLFNIDFNVDIKIINKSLDLFPNNSVLVVKIGNNKIRLLSKNEKIDANQLVQELIDRYNGKGGGNPKSAQAMLKKMPESLLSDIEHFLIKSD